MAGSTGTPRPSPVPLLRRALRSALLRHRADLEAGRTTEDVRAVGGRLAALLIEKQSTGGLDAVADVELRASVAAALAAELDELDRDGAVADPRPGGS